MWHNTARIIQRACLLALGSGICSWGETSLAQIYLSPNQQFPQGSRVSIDVGSVRCNSDGGALPSLNISAGAYPDQLNNNISVSQSNGSSSTGSQSSLLAMVSVNIPLAHSNPQFSCLTLLKDAQMKMRMENLRQLVDEDVITELQYKKALASLYGPLSIGVLDAQKEPPAGLTLRVANPEGSHDPQPLPMSHKK
jgi:hypothetical protein